MPLPEFCFNADVDPQTQLHLQNRPDIKAEAVLWSDPPTEDPLFCVERTKNPL